MWKLAHYPLYCLLELPRPTTAESRLQVFAKGSELGFNAFSGAVIMGYTH
jgi:hypothetical protein